MATSSLKRRELDQLLLVAKHYLELAKRHAKRHQGVLNKTIDAVTGNHVAGKTGEGELILAHAGSCAIRLSTMSEVLGSQQRYSFKYYQNMKRKSCLTKQQLIIDINANLDEYLHDLLRDHVAHEENAKDIGPDRWEILKVLTVGHVLSELESCATKIENQLKAGITAGTI